jgi:hypothetical protein
MDDYKKTALLARLNTAWENAKDNKQATQQKAALVMGYKKNSFISEMLNGKKPITVESAFKWSLYLEESPLELMREVVEPYAKAFHAMMNDVEDSEKDKDAIIYDLQKRLGEAGLNAEIKEPTAEYDALTAKQREILQLLTQLPGYETDLVLEPLRSRVDLLHGNGSRFTTSGKAAIDTPASPADITSIDPAKSKET